MGFRTRARVWSSNLCRLRVHPKCRSETQGQGRARALGCVRRPRVTPFETASEAVRKSTQEIPGVVWNNVTSSTAVYRQNDVMVGATTAPNAKLEVKATGISTTFKATLTDTGVGETGIVVGHQSSDSTKTPFEVLANGSSILAVSYDGTVSVNGQNQGSAVFKSTTATVTQSSNDLVTSGGVYTAISNASPSTIASVTSGSTALVTSGAVFNELEGFVTSTSLSTTLADYALDSDIVTYSTFDASTSGLVPAAGGSSTTKFLSQAGTFIIPVDTDTQADWDENDDTSPAFIQNKPTIMGDSDYNAGLVPTGNENGTGFFKARRDVGDTRCGSNK